MTQRDDQIQIATYGTLRDRVAELIRQMILDCELRPGERVNQDRLAGHLGTSTMPIREALRTLEAEDLVIFKPYRGVFVTSISMEDAEETYIMRAALEEFGVKIGVPKLQSADIAAMQSELESMRDSLREGESASFYVADRRFHEVVYAAAERPSLLSKVKDLRDTSVRYARLYEGLPGVRKKALDENEEILTACSLGDAERAAHIMRSHVMTAAATLVENIRERSKDTPCDTILDSKTAVR